MMVAVGAPARLLPLVGAYNFRDLGGYPTADGRTTRWGRLFRSDTLHELTDPDLQVLRQIGLETVIDLRGAAEVEGNGRGILEHEPIRYFHLPLIPRENIPAQSTSESAPEVPDSPPPPAASLVDLYLRWLESGRDALLRALAIVGD